MPGRAWPCGDVITIDGAPKQKIKCIKKCIRADMLGYVTPQCVSHNVSDEKKVWLCRAGVAAGFMGGGVTGVS